LGQALAELQGQRPLAQQALDYLQPDGRVHHEIAALQRSGRSSTTKPSLTTWSAHGPKASEKSYFVASPGRKLLELDLSNADQRILAAISGDPEYAKRFDDGVDGHEINARLMFGDDEVNDVMLPGWEEDDEIRRKNPLRDTAKAPGHAWTYGAKPKKLASTTGLPLETMQRFADGMAETYPVLAEWQHLVRKGAERQGCTTNYWGRTMAVQADKAWTQTPALHGQSGTTEILKDGLIRMLKKDRRLILWTVGTVHDALVLDIPEEELDWAVPAVVDCVETEINGISFTVASGKPADNWYLSSH
jgi:DNA polymerase I-like protein with 3'-5' exonuclease and polymerase domains